MATYKAYLFNMVTEKGSYILITEDKEHNELDLLVNAGHFYDDEHDEFVNARMVVSFKNMDTLQNFILSTTDKGWTNERILDTLANIILGKGVRDYE